MLKSSEVLPSPKAFSSPLKRSLPSWMGLPTRRGTLFTRDRPPRHLLHLLSSLSAREIERENFNVEMNRLLNQQTAMETRLVRRFRTTDTIQEYCQFTTRDECPSANPHSRRRSPSSSASSENEHQTIDEELQGRKRRKRDDTNEFNEAKDSGKRSSYYYRKNSRSSSTCGKVHFRRVIKSHTDDQLGDCSFLNTCFHTVSTRNSNEESVAVLCSI